MLYPLTPTATVIDGYRLWTTGDGRTVRLRDRDTNRLRAYDAATGKVVAC